MGNIIVHGFKTARLISQGYHSGAYLPRYRLIITATEKHPIKISVEKREPITITSEETKKIKIEVND